MTDRGGSGRAEDPPGLGAAGSDWEVGLRRLPFFTQRTAVLLLGVLVALVGWPGAGGPTKLVPGERAGQTPVSRPGAGEAAAPGARAPGAGDRSGADAGGAAATSPSRPGPASLMAPMSSSPAATQPPPTPEGRRKREILGPTGLIVMVVAILVFTAVAITIELASNRGKTFKATVTVLGPVEGSQNQVRLLFRVTNTGTRAGRPDKCEAVLYNLGGDRVGVGAVSLKEPIQPGATHDEPAIGTSAEPPVNGQVHCRALEPG